MPATDKNGIEMTLPNDSTPTPLWRPTAERCNAARVTHFTNWVNERNSLSLDGYEALWRWSTEDLSGFWGAAWEYFDIRASVGYDEVIADRRMPGARWFTGSRLNIVDQIFKHRHLDSPALIYHSEAAGNGTVSWAELERQVAALAATLRDNGIVKGDRVVAFLPNIPQTTVAMLACASVGAIWSVCAPEMGAASVLDRFKQIEPKAILACDGYRFAGKVFDRTAILKEILDNLPSVRTLIWVPHLDPQSRGPEASERYRNIHWDAATSGTKPLVTEQLPFDHPLWILYSSGTTGLPKGIVHGHGGILLTGLVLNALQNDLGEQDRYFWQSITSWAIWNSHQMGLLVGSTLLLFDGSPSGTGKEPDWATLWRIVANDKITHFGAGATFHAACMKAGIEPAAIGDLSSLVTLASSGSPLLPECYRWIYSAVKKDLWLNCGSGGTDICSAFVCGLPTLPVYEGEMQCRALGAAVHAFNDAGLPVIDEVGELVCTQPLPSMPVYFWNDPEGTRYLESYFETFKGPHGENIWRHGDFLKLISRPDAVGAMIYGRSDATIKRRGIRIGTSELYGAVETLPEVSDSLVVDLDFPGKDSYMVLFVVLRPAFQLDAEIQTRIRKSIQTALSSRHVPNLIVQVAAIPRTITGKKLELPVKKLMMGQQAEKVVNRGVMANPESIDWYIEFADQRLAQELSKV